MQPSLIRAVRRLATIGLTVLLAVASAHGAYAATQPWMNAAQTPEQRAAELLAAMTQAEKLAMLHGGVSCGYVGCVDANPRLGIPALHLQDGPAGVGDGVTGVTQLAAPVAGAATWDTPLMRQYGETLGAEQWGKGTNVVLGPTVNIVRDPRWGRAFESFGEDPYLAGQIGAADIQGIQSQGPMAQVKHYAVYNQETYRNSTADNAIVSDRTEREIYLPAFETSVKAGGADSAMCSYSAINGPFACENGPLQNTVLKNEWGFAGFITSDWGATHSTVASANNGLDMEMPGSDYYGGALTAAVDNGQVSPATIDDHVRRILTSMFRRGLFDHAQTGTLNSPVTSAAHTSLTRQVAAAGSVLLKNANSTLPIPAGTTSIAVVGTGGDASPMYQGGGSAGVNPSGTVSPYQGIRARAGSGVAVTYSSGSTAGPIIGLAGKCVDVAGANSANGTHVQLYDCNGTSAQSWSTGTDGSLRALGRCMDIAGAGTADGTKIQLYDCNGSAGQKWSVSNDALVNPTSGKCLDVPGANPANGTQLQIYTCNNTGAQQWTATGNPAAHDQAIAVARAANLAVVFVGRFEAEGGDLADINLPADQNQLVSDVAAANPNTVVVVTSGSAVTMPWAGAVRGIIEAWYPGQEYGNALASLLFGDVNPAGKLPVTFPASLADVPAHTTAQWPGQNNTVQYSEGIDVGYRWYDRHNITPLFPFGFGLSYTTFAYANLAVGAPDAAGNVAVSFDVTNTGARAGSEVAQVYVGQPAGTGEPPKNLRGFAKVTLNPGQRQRVTVTLDARSFQSWTGTWSTAAGSHQVLVGASSRDIRLTGAVTPGGGDGGGGGSGPGPIVGYQGLCVDVRSASTANGTPVQVYTCNQTAAQNWTVQSDGTLRALGKCLDVTAAGTANGTPVQLYDCNGTGAQVWQHRSDGSLLNPGSGKCLDDTGSSTTPGTQLQIWSCTAAANQLWTLPS
jgi:beta-glucosidase